MLACICAIDRAALPTADGLLGARAFEVAGVHELVGNALILEGRTERTTNLRGDDLEELKAKRRAKTDE